MRDSDYADRNAEVWESAGREIKKGKVILPDDSKLHEQMVNRFRTADPKGRIKAESKGDMQEKRGVSSPDRADAVNACIAIRPMYSTGKVDAIFPSWVKKAREEAGERPEDSIELPGADLGYH